MSDATGFTIPKIELGDWIETGLDYLTTNYSGITRGISKFTETGIDVLNDALMWLPEWALIALVAPAPTRHPGAEPTAETLPE